MISIRGSGRRRMVWWSLAIIVVLAAVGFAASVVSQDRELVSINLFEYPGSVCERFRESTFVTQVQQVEDTSDRSLRQRVALVRGGLTRKFVRRSTTEPVLYGPLENLADALERASQTDDFERAKQAAAVVDDRLASSCS